MVWTSQKIEHFFSISHWFVNKNKAIKILPLRTKIVPDVPSREKLQNFMKQFTSILSIHR